MSFLVLIASLCSAIIVVIAAILIGIGNTDLAIFAILLAI